MPTIPKYLIKFLADLKENNNREWFISNKSTYESARKEFMTFVDALIVELAKADTSIAHLTAKDCVFRIYRDVRFSTDKSPYKTNIGAYISAASRKTEIRDMAGYYIHISPGDSMLAGGAYMPQGPWLQAIRQEIAYNPDEFISIIQSPEFTKYFGTMEGEKLIKAPKGYAADHPLIGLLRHKSFLAMHTLSDEKVISDEFFNHCINVFRAMLPFNSFLNRSID